MKDYSRKVTHAKDELIRKALVAKGFDADNIGFIKGNFQRIILENDPNFEHFYYRYGTPDEQRIISISKLVLKNDDDFTRINYSASYNYY